MTSRRRRRRPHTESVLAALDNLLGFEKRGAAGRSSVPIVALRDRLLQMTPAELDETLLGLERDGRLALVRLEPGEGSPRERAAAIFHPTRGLLGSARRVRAGERRRRGERSERRRRSVERTLTLNVRVPAALLDALDRYVSPGAPAEAPLSMSRGAVARHLLERILDRSADDRRLEKLRSAILSAIAEAAQRTGTATLWDVRQRLAAIPQAELDRALIALEARGALVLAPRPPHVPETERDVRGALWCADRGPLSRVRLPVPQPRLEQARIGVRRIVPEKRRRMGRTG